MARTRYYMTRYFVSRGEHTEYRRFDNREDVVAYLKTLHEGVEISLHDEEVEISLHEEVEISRVVTMIESFTREKFLEGETKMSDYSKDPE